jgi:hypothetical protein
MHACTYRCVPTCKYIIVQGEWTEIIDKLRKTLYRWYILTSLDFVVIFLMVYYSTSVEILRKIWSICLNYAEFFIDDWGTQT